MFQTYVSGKLDSIFKSESNNRIFIAIEFYDDFMGMLQHIPIDVTGDIKEVYQNVEFSNDFIKEIQNKLKTTFAENTISIKYTKKTNWILNMGNVNLFSLC